MTCFLVAFSVEIIIGLLFKRDMISKLLDTEKEELVQESTKYSQYSLIVTL